MNITRKKKLQPEAVPKLLLMPGESVPAMSPRDQRQEQREREALVQSLLHPAPPQVPVPAEDSDKRQANKSVQTDAVNAKGKWTRSRACLAVAFMADNGCQTCTSSKMSATTQTDMDALQQENQDLRQKIKVLQRKLSRAQSRNSKDHKKSTQVPKAEAIKICFKNLAWTPQQIKSAVGGKRVLWKKEDIVLGLTIRALSKKTYQLLRKSKMLPLPSLSTLLEHIRGFNCLPGVQEEVLEGVYSFPRCFFFRTDSSYLCMLIVTAPVSHLCKKVVSADTYGSSHSAPISTPSKFHLLLSYQFDLLNKYPMIFFCSAHKAEGGADNQHRCPHPMCPCLR